MNCGLYKVFGCSGQAVWKNKKARFGKCGLKKIMRGRQFLAIVKFLPGFCFSVASGKANKRYCCNSYYALSIDCCRFYVRCCKGIDNTAKPRSKCTGVCR